MRKIINRLYDKYCRQNISTLYIEGMQRNFGIDLSEKDEKEIITATHTFVNSKAFDHLFNEMLKGYTEVLVRKGECEEVRNTAVLAINILMKHYKNFEGWSSRKEQPEEDFDKHNPI